MSTALLKYSVLSVGLAGCRREVHLSGLMAFALAGRQDESALML